MNLPMSQYSKPSTKVCNKDGFRASAFFSIITKYIHKLITNYTRRILLNVNSVHRLNIKYIEKY